jgi:hypothetical protein
VPTASRRPRSALDEPSCCLPLTECHGVGQRRAPADHCAGRFDVRSGVDQGLENVEVVAAGRSVERCLGVSAAAEPRVHVGASLDERAHDRRTVGEVSGPIRGDVQQRVGRPIVVANGRRSEAGVVVQQLRQRCEITGPDGVRDRRGRRLVTPNGEHAAPPIACMSPRNREPRAEIVRRRWC